jgi:hypothetical protein
MSIMKKSFIILVFILLTFESYSQLNFPNSSPDGHIKQEIGFVELEINYSRPGAKGRKIFGELVPFGALWRTGAHDATTIRFSEDVQLNDNLIPAGEYSLFTIPNDNEWIIVLNKETEMHGTAGYNEENDLIRFSVVPQKSARYYESFTIEINDIIKDEAGLYIIWENTEVKLNIRTNSDMKIMAEINERINIKKEDRPSLYYQSSMYYFNNNKDLKQALEWIKIANQKTDDFMYLQLQAKIEAALGDHKSAIKTAKSSSELAKVKQMDNVALANNELIQQWSSMLKKNKK